MTDATKDAIERLQAAFNSPVSVMGGESFGFRVEDVKTILTELDRLARENERLTKRQQSMQSWIDHHNTRADAAEARAERLATDLHNWLLTIAAGRLGSMGGERDTYCPQINRERVDAALAALNEPKAGTE